MSWFKSDPLKTSVATSAQAAAWSSAIGKLANLTGPLRQQDQFPALTALQSTGIAPAEAEALNNWLGGYAHESGLFGSIKNVFLLGDPDVYMQVDELTDSTSGTTVNVGDALRDLRDQNPAAHAWVVERAQAKHDKKQIDYDVDLEQHRTQVINKEIDIAQGAVGEVKGLAKGLLAGVQSLIDDAGKALANPLVTIAVVVAVAVGLGILFLVLESRIKRLVA